jgi:hypothetical protein
VITYQEWLKIVEGSAAMRDVARRFGLDDRALHGTVQTLMPAALFKSFGSSLSGPSFPTDAFKEFLQGNDIKSMLSKQLEQISGASSTMIDEVMPALAEAMADAMTRVTGSEPSAEGGDSRDLGVAIGGMMAAMMGLTPDKPKETDLLPHSIDLMQTWFEAGRDAQSDYINAMKAAFGPRE